MKNILVVLLFLVPYLGGRITLINVGNLSEDDVGHGAADHVTDNNTIVVGVMLPRNVAGNNDVVAKAECQLQN